MKAYSLEATVVALERTRDHALAADLSSYFISEIDHLIATVKANQDAEIKERKEAWHEED